MSRRAQPVAASFNAGVVLLLTTTGAAARGVTGAAVHGQVFAPDSVPIAEANG